MLHISTVDLEQPSHAGRDGGARLVRLQTDFEIDAACDRL
jgi:hypothetical protein